MYYYNTPKQKKYWTVKIRCKFRCDSSSDCIECRGKGWNLGTVYQVHEPHPSNVYYKASAADITKWESNYQKTLNRKGKQS